MLSVCATLSLLSRVSSPCLGSVATSAPNWPAIMLSLFKLTAFLPGLQLRLHMLAAWSKLISACCILKPCLLLQIMLRVAGNLDTHIKFYHEVRLSASLSLHCFYQCVSISTTARHPPVCNDSCLLDYSPRLLFATAGHCCLCPDAGCHCQLLMCAIAIPSAHDPPVIIT